MSRNKKYEYDYYRMTGTKYQSGIKSFVMRITHHNIAFMFRLRKYQEKHHFIDYLLCKRFTKKYGLEISEKAIIGNGLYLGHPYNITVGEDVEIGNNVNLHKGVTIGRTNRGDKVGSPKIGSRVYIGINATVVGNITIGNDVLIAPNSYVNFDVPSHSIVIGNPGVIHQKDYATYGYVNFIVGEDNV